MIADLDVPVGIAAKIGLDVARQLCVNQFAEMVGDSLHLRRVATADLRQVESNPAGDIAEEALPVQRADYAVDLVVVLQGRLQQAVLATLLPGTPAPARQPLHVGCEVVEHLVGGTLCPFGPPDAELPTDQVLHKISVIFICRPRKKVLVKYEGQ